jgi:hypothetical protein
MSELPKPPSYLYQMQKLFEETARTPFEFGEIVRPQPKQYNNEIVNEMVPIKGISGRKRILNYNQQYWYRLFTTMQEEFPLLVNLMGYQEFNRLVSGYLTKYPSRNYSLNFLSDDFQLYIAVSKDWNKPVFIETVTLERIFIKAFDALQAQDDLSNIPLSQHDLAILRDQGVGFQPSWYLFEENWNLVELRKKIKLADDPDKIKVKPKKQIGYWSIFRQQNRLYQEKLNQVQFKLLKELSSGASLMEAFSVLEENVSSEELGLLEKEVSSWFSHWVGLGWFTMPRNKI